MTAKKTQAIVNHTAEKGTTDTSMLNKYNLAGQKIGEVKIDQALVDTDVHSQLVKDYIIALRYNARQWSACTKTRSEVKHTTRKPHPQKGQGRSRQGSTVAPQYKGGGRVGGPKPKFDVSLKMNAREKRMAIRSLIADKVREGRFVVLESTKIDTPKTSHVARFLELVGLDGKTLFVGEGTYVEIGFPGVSQKVSIPSEVHTPFKMSVRNIPYAGFMLVCNMSGYDVMTANDIVITESALKELQEWLLKE